ncbi:nucleotidyltransferase domain-containing protein [Priestia endophytica]|uniref:nucleotidyltransferase domain-containing protein n=1 Tax=Priestia endophytica TaxID=135735 RepID=UPI000F530625|nr:hypothetical protein [Priestia endophytica]
MVAIKSTQLDFVMNIMKDFKYAWFFASGWSIDLGIGNVTRDHKDIDICIFREHALEVLSYFSEWTIYVAIPGEGRLELCQTLKNLDPPRLCLIYLFTVRVVGLFFLFTGSTFSLITVFIVIKAAKKNLLNYIDRLIGIF